MSDTAIVRRAAGGELAVQDFTRQQINVIKQTIMPQANDFELMAFVEYARRSGLDPFSRQIYAIPKRVEGRPAGYEFATGIDGLRLIAARTGEYEGNEGPYFCGKDGQWTEVWLDDKAAPAAAKIIVHRTGARPKTAIVRWKEFARIGRNGTPIGNWATHPAHMLGIAAERHALRALFPKETAGLRVEIDEDGEVRETQLRDPEGPASNAQKGELVRLARVFGWEDDERRRRAGVESFTELTKAQAHALIDTWREWEVAMLEDGVSPPDEVIEGELVEQPSEAPALRPESHPADVSEQSSGSEKRRGNARGGEGVSGPEASSDPDSLSGGERDAEPDDTSLTPQPSPPDSTAVTDHRYVGDGDGPCQVDGCGWLFEAHAAEQGRLA